MQLKPYEIVALMRIELDMSSPDVNRLAAFVELLKKSRARDSTQDNKAA